MRQSPQRTGPWPKRPATELPDVARCCPFKGASDATLGAAHLPRRLPDKAHLAGQLERVRAARMALSSSGGALPVAGSSLGLKASLLMAIVRR